MNSLRAHRLPLAWMLFAFILFNGLACSIGHGLMMGMEGALDKADTPSAVAAHASMPMDMPMDMHSAAEPAPKDNHDSLKSMFGACTFAGILAMAMVAFAALGWLIRLPQRPVSRYGHGKVSPLRLFFPALNPRAP
jgi:hypothetical protein